MCTVPLTFFTKQINFAQKFLTLNSFMKLIPSFLHLPFRFDPREKISPEFTVDGHFSILTSPVVKLSASRRDASFGHELHHLRVLRIHSTLTSDA